MTGENSAPWPWSGEIDSLRAEVERLRAELAAKWGDKVLGEGNWVRHEYPSVDGKVATHSATYHDANPDRSGEVERLRDALAAVEAAAAKVSARRSPAGRVRLHLPGCSFTLPNGTCACGLDDLSALGAPSTPPNPTP